jgi:hypothetical protein
LGSFTVPQVICEGEPNLYYFVCKPSHITWGTVNEPNLYYFVCKPSHITWGTVNEPNLYYFVCKPSLYCSLGYMWGFLLFPRLYVRVYKQNNIDWVHLLYPRLYVRVYKQNNIDWVHLLYPWHITWWTVKTLTYNLGNSKWTQSILFCL